MRQREFMKRLQSAIKAANQGVSAVNDGSKYGSGLASEGYAGGYVAALYDVEAMLIHGNPSDQRGYWTKDKDHG